MSANTDPTRGCDGKQRFETYSMANQIARKTSSRRPGKFKAYHCRHCAGFHYGRTTGAMTNLRHDYAKQSCKGSLT